jgi:hypothetical protein
MAETPKNLGSKGRALWKKLTDLVDFEPHELSLLEDVCRQEDLIERLDKELRSSDLMIVGSQGQAVINPIVQEIRQHRTVKAGLMAKIAIPDSDEAAAVKSSDRSSKARAAAEARWKRGA